MTPGVRPWLLPLAALGLVACSELDFVAIEEPPPSTPGAAVTTHYLHGDSMLVRQQVLLSGWTGRSPAELDVVRFGAFDVSLVVVLPPDRYRFDLQVTVSPAALDAPWDLSLPAPTPAGVPLVVGVPAVRRAGPSRLCIEAPELVFRTESTPLPDDAQVQWVLRIVTTEPAQGAPYSFEWRGTGPFGQRSLPTSILPAGGPLRANLEVSLDHSTVVPAARVAAQVHFSTEWPLDVAAEGACATAAAGAA